MSVPPEFELEPTTGPDVSEFRPRPIDPLAQILRVIENLVSRVSRLEQAAPLRQAGITVEDTGITADRDVIVNGDFTTTGNAHVGGTTLIDGTTTIDDELIVTADAEFGGTVDVTGLMTLLSDMIVNGLIRSQNFVANTSGWRLTSTGLEVNTLTAKDAIIGNQALAAPVSGDTETANTGLGGVTLTTTATDHAVATFTVPAGFTTAVVMAVANTYFVSASGVEISAKIGGDVGYTQITPSGQETASASHAYVVTGDSDGWTFDVAARAKCQSGTATAFLNVTATAFYLRP